MNSLKNAFRDEKHRPFTLQGGPSAALLIHGFPGTPAELRPLAEALHQAGWTVEGLLLPGFGSEVDTLFERDHNEWVAAVRQAMQRLQTTHETVLVVGYSMGAALAMQAAQETPPTAQVLIAPFLQLGTRWQNIVGAIFGLFVKTVRPFKDADFSDPQLRHSLTNFFPDADLDDPDTQEDLRQLEVPLSIFEQLAKVGQAASKLAPTTTVPTLIVQGVQDEVARQSLTRDFLTKFPGPIEYVEIEAGHDMIERDNDGWPALRQAVLAFAEKLQTVRTHENPEPTP